jgi:hypothetical protein
MGKWDKNSAVAKTPRSVAKHALDFGWPAVLKRDRHLEDRMVGAVRLAVPR